MSMAGISIYYQNVRGLRTKTNTFRLGLLESNYDILMITESWLIPSIYSSELFTQEYTIFRRDRDVTGLGRGGGVLIAIKNKFKAIRLFNIETESDCIWLKVALSPGFTDLLCVVYFTPNSPLHVYKTFFDKLDMYKFKNEHILILGDFNLPITGTGFDLSNGNEICKHQLFFNELYGLTSKNNVLNVLGRTLDLVLTDMLDLTVHEETTPLVKIDNYHPALILEYTLNSKQNVCSKNNSFTYNYSKANFYALYKEFATTNWNELYFIKDINLAVQYFYDKLYSALDLHVPKYQTRNSKYPHWYSLDLKKMISKKEKIRKKYKKFEMPHFLDEYNNLRRETKRLIKVDYENHMKTVENELKSNPKSFWGAIKSMKAADKNPSTMHLDDKEVEGGAAIAEALATYFSSVYEPSDPDLSVDELCDRAESSPVLDNVSSFCLNGITEQEVLTALKKLKPKKSLGPDSVPPYIFKACADIFVTPLHYLFNLSIKNNIFPDRWKTTKVVPVPKKGSKNDITNYRPISILSSPAKVFESIIYNRLFSHVKTYISELQHGFFPNRSITSNLLNFTQYCMSVVDSNAQVDVIYTDFVKAFDKVRNLPLLRKLHYLGFTRKSLSFFASYLHKRKQYVSYEGFLSDEFVAGSGVPQGSNLGPLLFLIFINDITKCVKNSFMLLYADDIKIYKRIDSKSDCYELQNDLNSLFLWSTTNLTFNTSKCAVMTYTKKTKPNVITFNYSLNGEFLSRKTNFRDLGVLFASNFSFEEHITAMCKSAYSILGFIRRSGSFLQNSNSLKLLFMSLVRSKLEYGSIVWYPHVNYLSERVENVQNKFLRFLYYKSFSTYPSFIPYAQLLSLFELTSLSKRREACSLLYMHKLACGVLDDSGLLSQLDFTVPRHNSRCSALFTPRYSRTNLGYYRPINFMTRLYNIYSHKIDLFHYPLKMVELQKVVTE